MKQFLLGLIKKLANIMFVVSIISALAGLILTLIPQLVNEMGLNLTPEDIGWLTGILTMASGAGGIAKYSSTALKKVTELNKSDMERKLKMQDEKHNQEIIAIKEQQSAELIIFTESMNELIDEVKLLRVDNQKILEVNAITARRNLTSNLVSKTDRELYRKFLQNMNQDTPNNIKNIYTSIENITEIVENDSDNVEEDLISQKLNSEEV